MSDSAGLYRFLDFELDVGAYELRRDGRPVRIERQPMDLLLLLIERRGQLVSRTEIVDHLWGKDVFVDVETGVHTAIRKIRLALRDSSEAPTCVETVSGKGYRFIASVDAPTLNGPLRLSPASPLTTPPVTPSSEPVSPTVVSSRLTGAHVAMGAGLAISS